MNFFSFSSIIILLSSLAMGTFLFLKGHGGLSRIWGVFCITVGLWGLGSYKAATSLSEGSAFSWWQLAYGGVTFTPILYFHFIYSLVKLKKRLWLMVFYATGLFFTYFILFHREAFFGQILFRYNQFYWFYWPKSHSILYLAYYISLYGLVLGLSFIILIRFYLNSSGILRNQLKYFILGSLIGWVGAEGNFLPKFFWNIYPYNNALIAVYTIIFGFAILKYRLMDVTVTITRAGLFIAVYTVVLGIPFAIAGYYKDLLLGSLGPNWWIFPLGLMAVLATAGPFFYIFLQSRAEDRILREQKRYQDVLKHAAIGMTRIRNLKKLLSLIARIVTKTVRISFAAIYLYDHQANKYSVQAFRGPNKTFLDSLSPDSTLIKWLTKKQEPLIYEEVKRQMQDSGDNSFKILETNMRLLGASVIIPSFLEQNLTGFLILGDKLSGQIYTPDDLSVFQVLASQAALAIENAQFYEEAQEMHAQIAQAEKMATIGTMADGLSHQINNRFYALALISGDSLDTIKLTDTSGCTPEIQEIFRQLKAALERIQANVMQGGEVVKGILKYTRKGDEGLEPLTIDQVLDGTIDMVQFKVKLSEIDIIRDYPQDTPKIKANLVQMQEVFFNFIDNAYDAIVERRNTLKEEGYRGKITITAKSLGQVMQIFVKDNGMGVKKDDFKKVFTPFFTTKTSSRKGTGLGLYVIRAIITETHKGKIDFQSEYKSGTCFTMEIPLAT